MKIVIDGETVEIPSGGGGEPSNGEVYSTEETIIGTWIDGKPLYRLVVNTVTPGVGNGGVIYYSDLTQQMESISRIEGTISLEQFFVPFNIYSGAYTAALFYSKLGKSIQSNISAVEYSNRPCFLILEYTKTTDQATASALSKAAGQKNTTDFALDLSAQSTPFAPVTVSSIPEEEG